MKERVRKNIDSLKKKHFSLVSKEENDTINAIIANRIKTLTFSKQRLAEMIGVTPDIVQPFIDQLEDDGEFIIRNGANRVNLSREQGLSIVQGFGFKSIEQRRVVFPDSFELPVVFVNVAKGGVAKTNTALHVAVEAANDIKKNRRVLLSDADVQGSLRHYLSHTASTNSSLRSVKDLIKHSLTMTREERLSPENQRKFREHLWGEVILPSYIDNLHFIPSIITDGEIPVNISTALGDFGKEQAFSVYKDTVINPLKDDFDIVFIDSGPSPDTYMAATLYASNVLLIPTTTRKQDYRAYVQYLLLLTIIMEQLLPHDYEGLHAIRTVITKHQNKPEMNAIADQIVAEGDCFTTRVLENKKHEEASANRIALQMFDTQSTKGCVEALATIRSLYSELDSVISSFEFGRV